MRTGLSLARARHTADSYQIQYILMNDGALIIAIDDQKKYI